MDYGYSYMGRHPFQVRHYSKRYPPAWKEEGVVMQLWNYVLCVASANVYDNPFASLPNSS